MFICAKALSFVGYQVSAAALLKYLLDKQLIEAAERINLISKKENYPRFPVSSYIYYEIASNFLSKDRIMIKDTYIKLDSCINGEKYSKQEMKLLFSSTKLLIYKIGLIK